jgi:hypothetical protein
LNALRHAGAAVTVPERSFHPDDRAWAEPATRALVEATILRPESISADVFGRQALKRVLADFFDARTGPVQVIGALFVYERYHETLPATLAASRQHAKTSTW